MEKYKTTNLSLSQLDIGSLSTSTALYTSSNPYATINYSNSIGIWDNSKQESPIEEDIKNNIKPRLNFTDLDNNEKLSIYDNLEIKPTITIDKLKEVVNNTLNNTLKEELNGYYLIQYPVTLGYSTQTGSGLREQMERINIHKY